MAEIRDNEGYRRFRVALQEGRLRAGMNVTQNELCDILGLSLSPLRETLVLLEEFGLVEIKPRTGIRIVYPEVAFIRENYQFRIMIETHAIRVFAASVSREWLAESGSGTKRAGPNSPCPSRPKRPRSGFSPSTGRCTTPSSRRSATAPSS